MKTRTRLFVFGVAAALTPVLYIIIAFNIPVGIALGPCLKDWTSPSSYQVRASKLATVDVEVDNETVRVCYGRPSARGRTVFGGLVPHGQLWRAGANEPTRLFTSAPLLIGDSLRLSPGRYSLYVLPTAESWTVFFSTSTFHWGNMITRDVRDREVGSVTVPVLTSASPVETLTVEGADGPDGRVLQFRWETTRVALPVRTTTPR